MTNFKILLVDACVPIAKFRGEEPPFQQQYSDLFFQLVQENELKVQIIKKVLDEIKNKFSAVMGSVEEFLNELRAAGKFELVENNVFQGERALQGILEIRKNAGTQGFDLSFCDSLQIFYAREKDLTLISWDNGIIDYCEIIGTLALRPNEFYGGYPEKYG